MCLHLVPPEEAFNMQEQAAAQNHPDAMFDTGIMLMKGQGVPANVSSGEAIIIIFFDCRN